MRNDSVLIGARVAAPSCPTPVFIAPFANQIHRAGVQKKVRTRPRRVALREELDERGTKPVIPNRCNRKQPFTFNKRLCRLRWRIENAFNRLKDFRRIATRYDKLARNHLASATRCR